MLSPRRGMSPHFLAEGQLGAVEGSNRVPATACARSAATLRGGPSGLNGGPSPGRATSEGGIIRQHEVRNARRDLGAESRAIKDAVVTNRGLHIVRLALARNVGAQRLRCLGLAHSRDIVVLAFDGHERDP